MKHRVLVADRLSEPGLAALREEPDIEVEATAGLSPAQLAERIEPYDALIVRSATRVTSEVVARAARLRVIGRAGIGVDNIDVDAATKRGIVVMNTPGGNNVTTAEHTITLMLALARHIPQADASVRAGRWERERFLGTEVCNKVLGVIGLGNIGSIVAELARGLRMKVIGYDPFLSAQAATKLGVELVTLDELYARADFVTVHTPLTPETRGLVGRDAIARMRPGVRILNCARGGIVDEEALAEAIRSGHVAGAALDVFTREPPSPDHSLLGLPGVICSPHLGASTGEAQTNVAVAIAAQIVSLLIRGVVQNAVNMPSLSPDVLQVLHPYLLLGEKLGSLQAQMLGELPREVTVECSGEVAERETGPITLAVLRGLLGPFLDTSVNYVNAPIVARERGVKVVEAHTSQPGDFLNSVRVRVHAHTGENAVGGAVFGDKTVRIVKINDFYLEAVPEGYILMLHNRDVPGVVGRVGTVLGDHGINIAGLELGREKVGESAISLFHIDEPAGDDVLDILRREPTILSAQLIRL